METKRALCICNTPLQILNMAQVIMHYYPSVKRDIIVTDEIKNCETLIKNVKESCFFDNVFSVKEDYKTTVFSHTNILAKIVALFRYSKRLKSQHDTTTRYDKIFFGGRVWLNNFIARQTKKTKTCEFIWVDEGTASYSTHGLFWKKNKIQRIVFFLNPVQLVKEFLGINYLFNRVTIQYLYRPEVADYQVPFSRRNIPLLHENFEKTFRLKQIFGFTEANHIKEKFIYFDGPGDEDGLFGNDKELLSLVAECVGKENLLVKVHPRQATDYYIQNGYHINTNLSIPWEIYCLEKDSLKDKILISIFSTALVSPYMYFGLKNTVISLIDMFDKSRYSDYHQYLLDFIKNNIFDKHRDIYLLPQSIDELKGLLK